MSVVDELTIGLVVLRAGDTDLDLADVTSYDVIAFGPGGLAWRRRTVSGPYRHGRTLIGAVVDSRTFVAQVRVYGATWAEVAARAETMFAAFAQYQYVMQTTVDDVVAYYLCEPADINIIGGDTYDKHAVMSRQQSYELRIPFDPMGVTS